MTATRPYTPDMAGSGQRGICAHCGKPPTPEGHDGCLGTLPANIVMNACCGHGNDRQAYVQHWDGSDTRGPAAIEEQKRLKERHGMTIKPETVQRDHDGQWTHSAWIEFCDDREYVPTEEVDAWLEQHGLEICMAHMQDEDTSQANEHLDNGGSDMSWWELSPPKGDGWFLLSIHDTEDGPVQVWAREKQETAS